MPRELPHAIVGVTCIPPSANAKNACDVIHTTSDYLGSTIQHPFMAINGDFNHVNIAKTLTGFCQYVKCPTRGVKTLDRMYANVKEAYRSTALPPLGTSDHDLIKLSPVYVPLCIRKPPTIRTVQQQCAEHVEMLRDCFSSMKWEMFEEEYRNDIEGLTKCITLYVETCGEHCPF